jgi:hypothetical protein
MQEEVIKLASQHKVDIQTAVDYYLMGGYEHAEHLSTIILQHF